MDAEGLHCLLWARADRRDVVRLVQKDFALELGLSKFDVNRLLQRMVADGRLRKLTASGRNGHTYHVMDPADFGAQVYA